LGPEEQLLFRRLGVFAASFPLPSAEKVCTGEGVDEYDVVDLLTALVDKSMVATDSARDGTTRYTMLESLREFARRQLDDASERDVLARRHAEHFADLAGQLQAQQRDGDLGGALARLDQDEADFRSSLRRTLDAGELTTAGRLVGGLGYLWYAAGQHREGLQWCDDLFALDSDLADEVLADALHSHASLLGVMGHADRAVEALERQVEIRRRSGDRQRLGAALNNLGDWYSELGWYDDAERVLLEAIVELRSAGSYGVSLSLSTLADGRFNQGQYDQAARDYRESLEEARRADHAYSIAVAIDGLGRSFLALGQTSAAKTHLIEARERFVELTIAPGIVNSDIFLGVAERDLGDLQAAAHHLLTALNETGIHWSDNAEFWTLQFVASVISDRATAAVLVGAATAGYERSAINQPAFVIDELHSLRNRLESELDPEELGRHFRAGGRRTLQEAVDIGRASLTEDHQ
jgi:tetratricopeptide (TPR) repeat protein